MEFCPECENMLWLKIITDSDEQKSAYLKKYCKNCNYTTSKIENNRIYENTYNFKDASYKSKVNKYLCHDRTLPRVNNLDCPNTECPTHTQEVPKEVVYINYDKDNLKYVYECCICNTRWRNDFE